MRWLKEADDGKAEMPSFYTPKRRARDGSECVADVAPRRRKGGYRWMVACSTTSKNRRGYAKTAAQGKRKAEKALKRVLSCKRR